MNKVKVYVLVSFYDENGLHKKGSIATINEEDFNPLYMELLPNPPTIPAGLEDLDDVDLTGVEDGDVLTYDAESGDWVPAVGGSGGAETLAELTDVDVVGAEDGQVLAYDGTEEEWIAKTIASGIPFVEGAGSNKVWTGTISDVTTLTAGMMMLFKTPEAISENDSSSTSITININDLGAKNLDKGNIINASKYYGMDDVGTLLLLVYDGTKWVDITTRTTGKVSVKVDTSNANYNVYFGSLNSNGAKIKFTNVLADGILKYNPNKKLLQVSGGKIQANSFDLTSSGDTIGDYLKGAIADGLTLGAISDVDTSSAADGKVLSYDSANSKWKATTPSVPVVKVSYDMTSTENQTVTGGASSPSAFIGWLQSSGNSISSLFGTVDAPGLHTWFDDDIFKIVEFDFANTEKLVSQVKVVSGASNTPCLVFELACADTGVAYLTIKAEIVVSSKPLSQLGKLVQTW
jgi:hypothetical protein